MALDIMRTGMITSSEIVALTTFDRSKKEPGAPFYTYVDECIMERFFKMKLESDVDTFSFAWGKLCEKVVHDLLPFKYIMQSEQSETHKRYPEWKGTPDGTILNDKNKVETVTDIKCPNSRKSFYNLIKPLYNFDGVNVSLKENVDGNEAINWVRENHKDGNKYYWQLVSNACITGAKYAELIIYMPYLDELEDIKQFNANLEDPYWLVERCKFSELPHILPETGIKNINIIRFEVPIEDKIFLEQRVKLAIEKINE